MDKAKRFTGYTDDKDLPIKRGDVVTIRKGVIVRTIGKRPKPAGKTHKIKVDHVLNGMSRHESYTCGTIEEQPPYVRWAGSGGYWSEVDINDIPEAQS